MEIKKKKNKKKINSVETFNKKMLEMLYFQENEIILKQSEIKLLKAIYENDYLSLNSLSKKKYLEKTIINNKPLINHRFKKIQTYTFFS